MQQQAEPTARPPRVSAAMVARACGVSPATVSYVMNGKGGVAPDTRRHIIKIANELGYRPSESAGTKRDPTLSRVIGLVLPNIVNHMYTGWAEGVITAAAREGFEVFVATTQDDPDTLANVAATLAARNVDGVITAATLREDSRALRTLRQRRVPVIALSRRSDHLPGDFVGIDDYSAAAQLMQHVLEHGYREVATVIGPRFSSASHAREQAFVATAAAGGVTITGARKVSTSLNRDGGRAAAAALLRGPTPPRAIVCGSDEIAIGVMEEALTRGLRVPEDVAVVGSDGLPQSRSALIRLTTIVQPVREMAEQAFALLLEQLTGTSDAYAQVICEHRIHIGRTCGCT